MKLDKSLYKLLDAGDTVYVIAESFGKAVEIYQKENEGFVPDGSQPEVVILEASSVLIEKPPESEDTEG